MLKIQKLLTVLAVTAAAIVPATASEKTDAMKLVNQFADSFNKGDAKAAAAACAEQTSIIDDFPPHEWHGAGACAKWLDDYGADAAKNAITDGVVTLGKARHVSVTADHAYIVVPANYVYKKSGTEVRELGSMLTIALHKEKAGWRITGWAWSMH
jgi:ketosteroid isomerase-like protein